MMDWRRKPPNRRGNLRRLWVSWLYLALCPVNCQYHLEFSPFEMTKTLADDDRQYETYLAEKQKETDVINLTNKVAPEDQTKIKKNTRIDGFTSPAKFAKKQKVLQNYFVGANAPVKTSNQYQALAGNSTLPDQDITAVPVATPKILPINLKF
ncbi:hypothetical protein TNIN_309531 [Trichonephila inaurata madagascariensis]|uniref:Uncharacterized protein n=1 Tax=Trichonephila inaurata madagascariensis TaxID=2747483 RepID=A0A8X6Y0C4_9ARAC|nr:hypothetical protein TNIN_309531 [Trichonephila inaurata madagascariensis]